MVPPGPPPPEVKNFIEPAMFSLPFLPIKKAQLKAPKGKTLKVL